MASQDLPLDIDVNEYQDVMQNRLAHYTLATRGHSLNAMIDAATPLFGMILRIQDIDNLEENPHLYSQIVADINAIKQTLQDKRYEPGMIVTFQYILCTFIDEVAMKHSWESKTNWRKESLLVHFHNETWGGEKIFVLLDRLMGEPHRYRDLLNFLYLCFCLGLRGRYALESANIDEFNKIFHRLHKQIQSLNGVSHQATTLNIDFDKTHYAHYQLPKKLTIKKLFWGGFAVLLLIFVFYSYQLNDQSHDILKQLNALLK